MSLIADRVDVKRSGKTVLRQTQLAIQPGELLAVIGPNGAGKSTLLDVLAGNRPADSGQVTLDGRPLTDWPRQALARRRAVLSQAPVLDFAFSVLDVVMLGRSPHAGRSSRARDMEVATAVIEATGLTHLADRAYIQLSGGERQRVQLARTLAQVWPEPDTDTTGYLLLDEPTNNLDLAHQHLLLSQARQLCAQGIGVLAILHDPNLAAQYADRLAIQWSAQPLSVGTPAAMLTPERMAEVFGVEADVMEHPRNGRPVVVVEGIQHGLALA